jgi:hypothetical protein
MALSDGVVRAKHSRVMSAATTNATSVKVGSGVVVGWHLANTSAAVKFVKLYDKASAPTVGTDVPIHTIALAANGRADAINILGIPFTLGIAYAITGAAADSDATAVALNDIVGGVLYI